METIYIVMGIMETGEISRFCDEDFPTRGDAQEWINANWENFPECGSSFYVETIHSQIAYEWEPDESELND